MTPNGARLLLDAFQAASHIRNFSVGCSFEDYLTPLGRRTAAGNRWRVAEQGTLGCLRDSRNHPQPDEMDRAA